MTTTPLAIEMLLELDLTGAPPAGEAKDWLIDGDLIWGTGSDGNYRVSDRGRAWLDMIIATPLPELKWVDPRDMPPAFIVESELGGRTRIGRIDPVFSLVDGIQVTSAGDVNADLPVIPAGFTPWPGGDMPCNRADIVQVARRSGKLSDLDPAQVFVWKHSAKPDDVIGYRITQKAD